MKVKAISRKKLTKTHFFLLMVVPLLIGAFITISSVGHATKKENEEPNRSPLKQGWVEFKGN
ncbi:MAG: hypothetical protein ACD_16C00129G0003 [uncultured bacterium]|nr:MAG: hypothetical protein ACD_16C00129G0003 [uncultured bacterium]OFW69608.1 MAG: hypothetical protein A2X70_01180 [Alphaproteobacteria bacterium GWC2_42_16]OFW74131.1 MAG: hypothetical protein A2Z80_04845 [Alphaproteobacteria bacterium GWA2_41_27]OFW84439.1 MAG: hypothetical protein A3E50_03530 [Alphaproteobacteria bacterium RIFCSPHIGHO2_12_FULL_42_100]OFW85961.1 MAG: hypothetical protein A2W06_05410 [Alphaproteobacteria bacterium RBG_16_42_14]OFW92286.1 MAG: hypothetical protein A3C41_031